MIRRPEITGLFYYDGYRIITGDSLKINGQFDFNLIKVLIFDKVKEDSILFNYLSDFLEIDKWHTITLHCILQEVDGDKFYEIISVDY